MANRETVKNLLRGRSCKMCGRNRQVIVKNVANYCKVAISRPEEGVCSQWMHGWAEKTSKNMIHKRAVREKRREKKAAKDQSSRKTITAS